MTFYSTVLLVHSWTRWLVVAAALAALLTQVVGALGKRPFGAGDGKAMKIYLALFDTQVALGLLLYFALSPLGVSLLSDMGSTMKQPALRYFAVEHIFGMIVALGVAHVLWVKAKKGPEDKRRGRALAAVLVPLLLVLGTMPWPGRAYARPLFRTSVSSAGSLAAPHASLT